MAYETEMKAWVDDWEAVERYLRGHCVFERRFRKEDRYFSLGKRLFRIRADGRKAYVTFKEKSVRDGTEFNMEREFGVDDADAFGDLAAWLGCRESFAKAKEGLHFVHGDLTVELVHVEELGDFLEVEYVHDDNDADRHADAASRIRTFLAEAGIDERRIEAQPYMKLLREVRSGTKYGRRNGRRGG